MSLAQHVTATEGTDREEALVDLFEPLERRFSITSERERRLSLEYGPGPTKSVRRIISYDVLAKPDAQQELAHAGITPYNVSTAKRLVQVVTIVLACWFASGIVFGFAALKPIFIREGVFRELCREDELADDVEVCYEQDLRLNFFFSLASTTCNVSALPIGTALDRYGPKVCFLAGCLFLSIGSILMSLAFQIPEFDGYTVGNFFLALGGTCIFIPSFSIANAFPKYAGTIVALITGAFDASAAVFLFYRLAYEATDGKFNPQIFFLVYLVVPITIFLAQVTFLPKEAYKTAPQLEHKIERAQDPLTDVHSSDDELTEEEMFRRRRKRSARRQQRLSKLDDLVGDKDLRRLREEKEEERQQASAVWGVLHNKSAREQMLSPWFILITLLTVLQMLRMNFFISTIREQYEYMLHSPTLATHINTFFDWALPLGGVLSTPFLGLMLDHIPTPIMLLILVTIITLVGIAGSLPFLWAGYANVLLFVFLRPLYYSAMSDYATKVFGFATFGRVYGTIICLSGIVNFGQTGIVAFTKGPLEGNPVPVNVGLTVLGSVIGIVLVGFVSAQGWRLQRRLLEEEDAVTVAGTETESVLDSLLEEDERGFGGYGSINRQ